jgi:hypothetical protein
MSNSLNEEVFLSIEFYKLLDNFSMRVPVITKKLIEKLTPVQKKKLNEKILITIAEVLHDANFNPIKYLKEE